MTNEKKEKILDCLTIHKEYGGGYFLLSNEKISELLAIIDEGTEVAVRLRRSPEYKGTYISVRKGEMQANFMLGKEFNLEDLSLLNNTLNEMLNKLN